MIAKIFVIEDNDTNYLLLEEYLSAYKVNLIRAETGKQFYSILEEQSIVTFDLILMDIMLPDTDGIKLTKYLLDSGCKVPIVFISAYSEKCEEIFDMGIEYFINKPVMAELLISIISKFIPLDKA